MDRRKPSTKPSTTLVGSLKERLDSLDAESAKIKSRLDEIGEQRTLMRKLLEIEMKQSGRTDPARRKNIDEIVKDALLAGNARKDDIQEAAEDNGHVAPARSVNAILMSYVNHGYVEREGEEYALTAKGKAAFGAKAA